MSRQAQPSNHQPSATGAPPPSAVGPDTEGEPSIAHRTARTDVIVIGGGPAGSAAALRLARRGLQVVQLERRRFGAGTPDRFRSGEGAIPATVRALHQLGAGLPADAWTLTRPTTVRMRWPDGTVTVDALPGGQYIRMIDRERFDTLLWNDALTAGVDARCGWTVQRLLVEGAAVTGVVAKTPAGETLTIQAPLVIDGAGRNAPSIRQFGLRRPERGGDFIVVVMFFDDVPDVRDAVWEVHFFDRQAPAIMQGGRLTAGVVRFGLGTYQDVKHASGLTPEAFFWHCLRSYPELEARLRAGRVVLPIWARARLGFRAARVAQHGLLLVGDAAGYVNPVLGDGILLALRSAALADAVAAEAFARGDFSLRCLQRYERSLHAARRMRVWIARALLLTYRSPTLVSRLGHLSPLRHVLLHGLMRA